MNWFNNLWQLLLRKGISFSWKHDWPGDEKLPPPDPWPKTVTKKDCEKEIENSLHKKEE